MQLFSWWASLVLLHAPAMPDGAPGRPREGHPHALGLSVGVDTRNQRDENVNPTRYAGTLGRLTLHYTHRGPHRRHAIDLGGGGGLGRNRYDRSLLWIDLATRYTFVHRVTRIPTGIWLGFSVGGGPRLYQFREEDSDHVNWQTTVDLGPVVQAEHPVVRRRRHDLAASLALPALGILSRPPRTVTHNNDDPRFGALLSRVHHDPRFASWHNLQRIVLDLRWSVVLTPRVRQSLVWRSEYVRIAVPEPVATWTHGPSYRLDVGLGR